MESSNTFHLLWTVEGIRINGPGDVFLSRCHLYLECRDRIKLRWLVTVDDGKLTVVLTNSNNPMREIELEFVICLLTSDGGRWKEGNELKIMWVGQQISLAIASSEELQNYWNLFGGVVRLSIGLRPMSQSLPRSVTVLATGRAGTKRSIKWTVERFWDLRTGEERMYALESFCRHKVETGLVLFLKDGNVCVRITDNADCTILVQSVRILQTGGCNVTCWEGEKFLQADVPGDCLAFLEVDKLIRESTIYLPYHQLTISFQITDYADIYPCGVTEVIDGEDLTPSTVAQVFAQGHNTEDSVGNGHPDCYIGRDFQALLDNETLSDFKLRVGRKRLPVHRAVLCARSPVFRAMLESLMIESCNNEVDVPDFRFDTVRRLVRYLYSGTTCSDMDFSAALDLYSAADKYLVLELRDLCSRILVSRLDAESACRLLSLSDSRQDACLKEEVLNYIRAHEQDVFLSREWAAFMREDPVLALQVSHHVAVKKFGSCVG